MIRAVKRGRSNSVANWLPSCSCFPPPSHHPCKSINRLFVHSIANCATGMRRRMWNFQFPNWDIISCIRDLPRLPARFATQFLSVLFGLGSIVWLDLPPRETSRNVTVRGEPHLMSCQASNVWISNFFFSFRCRTTRMKGGLRLRNVKID